LMACCMKSIAISSPNSSPATRVNLLMMEQAPHIAIRNSIKAVQTQTLNIQTVLSTPDCYFKQIRKKEKRTYHPDQAKKRLRPSSGLAFAKLNMKVYMMTVGSATPRISSG